MDSHDELAISQVVERSGFAASALRYYESQGLIEATRSGGGQRRYERSVLRRLAFIRAAAQRRASAWRRSAPSSTGCPTAAPRPGPTGSGSPGTGDHGSTSRSRPWSDSGTGWTPASAAAACP